MTAEQTSLFERIEPTLGADEDHYRRHFFASDLALAKGSALIVLCLASIVFALELTTFPPELLGQVAIARAAFLVVVIVSAVLMRGETSYQRLDAVSVLFSTGFAIQYVALLAIRPASRVDDMGMLLIILSCYLLSPAKLAYRTLAPVTIAIGSVVVLKFSRHEEPLIVWPTVLVLVASNALGFWVSARLQSQRRRQFLSQERLRVSLQERDALIDRLRQSNKMESLGRIVGGVAHDFNNILGSMFAAIEFLRADLPGDSPSREDVDTLRASTLRGAELTKQLLAFGRQQVLAPRVLNLNELVTDTQRMLSRTIGEHVTIKVTLDAALPSVRADPGQIQQILLNLSVNARDAMPSGGTLHIKTVPTTLMDSAVMSHSVAPPGSYVVLSASDTGIGIDAAILPKIFEPFFTTKPKGKGTGLGLSTVFGIVEQSGGHVRVVSAVGIGTTFEVFLPAVAERPVAVAVEAARPRPSAGTETILLAEDDEALRVLLARVLSMQGYAVLAGTDGADALRIAQQHGGPIHLLASDVVMPIMGGQELAQELVQRRPGVKVLFMSGYTDDAFSQGRLGPGDAFLQKPFDPASMLRMIRAILDEERLRGVPAA